MVTLEASVGGRPGLLHPRVVLDLVGNTSCSGSVWYAFDLNLALNSAIGLTPKGLKRGPGSKKAETGPWLSASGLWGGRNLELQVPQMHSSYLRDFKSPSIGELDPLSSTA